MVVRFGLAVIITLEEVCLQRGAFEVGQRRQFSRAVCEPLVDGDIHGIELVCVAAVDRHMKEPEIPRLMSGQPVTDDIDIVLVTAENDDIGHVIPGFVVVVFAGVRAGVEPVAVAAVNALYNMKAAFGDRLIVETARTPCFLPDASV